MQSKYYLFLDDVRKPNSVYWVNIPHHDWTIVRSYKEFCDIVSNKGIPEFVCYDHDLAIDHYDKMNSGEAIDYNDKFEKTGYDCAKFLCGECLKANVPHPQFVVHSMNSVGKENILQYIKRGYLKPE